MPDTNTTNQANVVRQEIPAGGEPGALPVDVPTGRTANPIASPGYIPVDAPAADPTAS